MSGPPRERWCSPAASEDPALFGVPDHDATVVSESVAGAPVAGMFCAGEFGPVGGANFVHGLTASVLLFD